MSHELSDSLQPGNLRGTRQVPVWFLLSACSGNCNQRLDNRFFRDKESCHVRFRPKTRCSVFRIVPLLRPGRALIIVLSWLAMVIADLFRRGMPVIENYYQAAVLAVVFVGYAVGWRRERWVEHWQFWEPLASSH